MSDHSFAEAVHTVFTQNGPTKEREKMEQYMRNQFPFFGFKAPKRNELLQPLLLMHKEMTWNDVVREVNVLWNLPEREHQYAAMALLERKKSKLPPDAIQDLERWITEKSWWDTVDFLAGTMSGAYFKKKDPKQVELQLKRWIQSKDKWIRRTALLTQLKWKGETNSRLLFELIQETMSEKEFFIQKAIGWSLREYSKTAPSAVTNFVEANPLAPLSKREALKWLQKQRS